jgi:polysaccharide export outer membrane protein
VTSRNSWKAVFACSVAIGIAGCAAMPTSGPAPQDIRLSQDVDYGFVQVTPQIAHILAEFEPRGIGGVFPDRRPPPEIRFDVGDVVAVTIFEAAAGGLFIPSEAGVRPGNFVQLPNQPVDTSGNISVPYAGVVKAKGRTPSEIQRQIIDAIKNRAIEPQVVVALATQNTSLISVLGEVNQPARFAAMPAGEHVLDSIARAGGIKDQGYETWVTLDRKGKKGSAPFGALIYQPENNIWVHPGDTIYVYREPQTFLAFGASGQQGQFPFGAWRISLAEAIAKAGGLLDVQADPASVFLYRREPRELALKLGIDCSKFVGPTVPVIYSVNFREPGGYFLGTKIPMRDKDIVFAANAASVETAKFLQFVRVVIATGNDAVVGANNTQLLRINSH